MDTKRQAERASGGEAEPAEPTGDEKDLHIAILLASQRGSGQLNATLEAENARLKAQLAGANGTNARWMAATGCATPEEYEQFERETLAVLDALPSLKREPNHGG